MLIKIEKITINNNTQMVYQYGELAGIPIQGIREIKVEGIPISVDDMVDSDAKCYAIHNGKIVSLGLIKMFDFSMGIDDDIGDAEISLETTEYKPIADMVDDDTVKGVFKNGYHNVPVKQYLFYLNKIGDTRDVTYEEYEDKLMVWNI